MTGHTQKGQFTRPARKAEQNVLDGTNVIRQVHWKESKRVSEVLKTHDHAGAEWNVECAGISPATADLAHYDCAVKGR